MAAAAVALLSRFVAASVAVHRRRTIVATCRATSHTSSNVPPHPHGCSSSTRTESNAKVENAPGRIVLPSLCASLLRRFRCSMSPAIETLSCHSWVPSHASRVFDRKLPKFARMTENRQASVTSGESTEHETESHEGRCSLNERIINRDDNGCSVRTARNLSENCEITRIIRHPINNTVPL